MDDFSLNGQVVLQGSKYKIVKVLGVGGFGITYDGIQTGLNRKVAIKEFFMRDFCSREGATSVTVTKPADIKLVQSSKEKFLKEACMIADLQHTNIVNIFDVFEENNTAYYVMEHIPGGSLQDYIANRGPISEKHANNLIRQIASALDCVHQHKILHLDVKPSNVMLRDENTAALIDFGISKHYSQEGNQTTMSAGFISRGYAPLEQYNEGGVATFSPASDIYSLGATLFYMLTGNRPPEAQIVMSEGLPPFPKGISQSTRETITASMRPRRKDRPQSIKEFLSLLDGMSDYPTTIIDNPKPKPKPKQKVESQFHFHVDKGMSDNLEKRKDGKEETKTQSKTFSLLKLLKVGFFVGLVTILGWGWFNDRTVGNLEEKANKGDAIAQYNLGKIYQIGEKRQKNLDEAIKWFKMSAEQGNSEAQYELGCYYSYDAVPKNKEEAVKWLRMSAQGGNAKAMEALYSHLKESENLEEQKEAILWLTKAAEQGYDIAQFNLGLRYDKGEGVPQNYAEAVKWYEKAADQGVAEALYNLGVKYQNGEGVQKSEWKAHEYFKKAKKKGFNIEYY